MKTKIFIPLLILTVFLSSCIKDKSTKTYTIYRPEFSVRQSIKDNAFLQSPSIMKNLGSFALYNNMMFINEKNKGIHVIDCSQPSNPVNKGFIPIPGNTGLAIKNDALYADCYCDLLVFSISNKENISCVNALPNIFQARVTNRPVDTTIVKVTWITKDTSIEARYYNYALMNSLDKRNSVQYATTSTSNGTGAGNNVNPGGSGATSVGSSLSVFTIINDYLYTVDQTSLRTFLIGNGSYPELKNTIKVGSNVETIYPFKDKLFIGSMTGMFAYSLNNPASPKYISQYNHINVCDPVIADDNYAFVTLSSGTRCGGFNNQMDILDIRDVENPELIQSIRYTNPKGLSKEGNVLFLCDGNAGLKVLDVTDVSSITTRQSYSIGNALDVIALDQKAYVMLETGIKIYSFDQQFNVNFLGGLNK
jgi:hypothetical protein